LVSFCNSSVG